MHSILGGPLANDPPPRVDKIRGTLEAPRRNSAPAPRGSMMSQMTMAGHHHRNNIANGKSSQPPKSSEIIHVPSYPDGEECMIAGDKGKHVSEEAPAIQPPRGLQGYLSKQGGGTSFFGRKNWKVRYFLLRNGVMSYFVDKASFLIGATPLGSFHVLAISSIKTMPQKDRNYHGQFHREIVLPHWSFLVCCDSEDILNKWTDAINEHRRYTRTGSTTKQVGMRRRDALQLVDAWGQMCLGGKSRDSTETEGDALSRPHQASAEEAKLKSTSSSRQSSVLSFCKHNCVRGG